MIAHSLPYREGFDAHFPLHCTTRQTSLSSVLLLHKIDHFHSPIQNDFQVFGARYFGGVVLCGGRSNIWMYHTGDALLFARILPHFSLTAVLIATANPYHGYSHKEPQNQGVSHNLYIWHAPYVHTNLHKWTGLMMLMLSEEQEEQLQSECLGKGCTGTQAVWLTWEAFLGTEQLPRAGCASAAAHTLLNWVQPIQEQFKGARSYEDETKYSS